MARRKKEWYRKRIVIIKRLKSDDRRLIKKLLKHQRMHDKKIAELRKRLKEMG